MIDKVIAYIDGQKDAYVERLCDFLRIESISTEPEKKGDMQKGAEWVLNVFNECGIEAQIVETAGHASVLADTGPAEGDGPTVLIYGHYDVQPTGDLSLWDSPPFEPTIRDGAIFARGSADDKGQVFAHMLAIEAWKKAVGKLPIRVKFLVEGEEEIGSAHLEPLVREHKDRLACDYVILSDTPKFDMETPAITYGTKGLIYKEIVVTGPKQNLHSGSFGGTITNPGNALALIVASLRDADNRVTIPGFYDDVMSISDQEKKKMSALPFDEDSYRDGMGVVSLEGEKGFTTLERRWARPTLDVNGMLGGFTGPGSSTVIPAKMMAKVSMRIVPNQDPVKIGKAFDEAVMAAAPAGVKVEIVDHASAGAYVSPLGTGGISAAAEALKLGFGKEPFFIREGGTLPILPMFKDVLGAESLMMGLCMPNCNAHGPNEFFHVSDLHNGARASAHFVNLLSRV